MAKSAKPDAADSPRDTPEDRQRKRQWRELMGRKAERDVGDPDEVRRREPGERPGKPDGGAAEATPAES